MCASRRPEYRGPRRLGAGGPARVPRRRRLRRLRHPNGGDSEAPGALSLACQGPLLEACHGTSEALSHTSLAGMGFSG